MSNIVDRVFNEVCLDERITDGIFRMEEETHMDALRDYFIKKGISEEAAINVTNRMVEGRFPERQAYNANGILCTFPTPEYKKRAIEKGTHFEKNPKPQPKPRPVEEPPEKKPFGGRDKKDDEKEEEPREPKGAPVFPQSTASPDGPKVRQGDKELDVEPPRGKEKPEATTPPAVPAIAPVAKTPERIAAEKEVSTQIINTDDNALTKIEPQINESCRSQLSELLKYADSKNYREAVLFLINYVNP